MQVTANLTPVAAVWSRSAREQLLQLRELLGHTNA